MGNMIISFIIPAYNSSEYLSRCLDSLLNQPNDDFEIIIIDDGSADATPDIIARYAAQNSCIKTFRQANSGQGTARNFGISQAQGEYIWFIDSDDWIEENTLPRIHNLLSLHTPDVLFCNYIMASDDGHTRLNLLPPSLASCFCRPDELSENDLSAISCWCATPWRLLTRRALLIANEIRFAAGLFYEDHPFAIQVMQHAQTVFVDAPPSYVYYQNPGSTVRRQDRRVFDFIPIRKACLELFREYGWRERYPNLYASYLLPVEFIQAHVPVPMQKEFLQTLQEELTDANLAFLAGVLQDNPRVRACMQAIKQGSMRPYHRLLQFEKAGRAVKRVHSREFLYRLLKLPISKARAARRRLVGLLRNEVCEKYHQAHPSTPMHSVGIDIRLNKEARPYVYAAEDALLSCWCVFETGQGSVHFGRRCSVGHGTMIICTQEQGIQIGNNTMVSWGCTIVDNNSHCLDPELRHNDAWHWKLGADYGQLGLYKDWANVKKAPVVIEDDVWIGFNSVIMAGVTIGRGAVVGAHSVVSRPVPAYTIFAGTPARFIRLVPRQCGWTWRELTTALQAAPECAAGERTPEQYLAAALRYNKKDEFIIRELPSPEIEDGPRGQIPEQISEYWIQIARMAGAATAKWRDGVRPALVLSATPATQP